MYDTHCNSMYNSTGVAEGLWRPGCARGDICGEVIVVGIDIRDYVAYLGHWVARAAQEKSLKKQGRISGRLKRELIGPKVPMET